MAHILLQFSTFTIFFGLKFSTPAPKQNINFGTLADHDRLAVVCLVCYRVPVGRAVRRSGPQPWSHLTERSVPGARQDRQDGQDRQCAGQTGHRTPSLLARPVYCSFLLSSCRLFFPLYYDSSCLVFLPLRGFLR